MAEISQTLSESERYEALVDRFTDPELFSRFRLNDEEYEYSKHFRAFVEALFFHVFAHDEVLERFEERAEKDFISLFVSLHLAYEEVMKTRNSYGEQTFGANAGDVFIRAARGFFEKTGLLKPPRPHLKREELKEVEERVKAFCEQICSEKVYV